MSDSYVCQSSDTTREAEEVLFEIYRRMTADEKLRKMIDLTKTADKLARLDLKAKYPRASEKELLLRLAARKYDRQLLVEAFSWDPEAQDD